MAKKYYWLKLKNGWFDSKVIKKLRRIAGGDTYTIIYLKMLLLSLKNEGKLVYEGIEESMHQELALELDEDEDNVQVTLNFLMTCGLLEMVGPDEYFLTEVPSAIGSESESAERVRKHRNSINKKKEEQKALQCNTNVTERNSDVTECNTEIDIEKDIDKEKDINIYISSEQCSEPEPEPIITLPLNTGEEYPFYQKDIDFFQNLYPAVDVLQAMRGMVGWLTTNPGRRKTKRGIKRFVNSWLSKEQDKGGTGKCAGYSKQASSGYGNITERLTNENRGDLHG